MWKRTMIWLLAVVEFMSQRLNASYMITTTSGSWTSMRTRCSLATPQINISAGEITVSLGLETPLILTENVWVGYTADMEIFRFYGCIPVTSSYTKGLNASIGLCYSACPTSTFFGVMKNGRGSSRCQCIDNINYTDLGSCNISTDRNFAFGGNGHVAVYKRVLSDLSTEMKNLTSWKNWTSDCFCYFDPTNNVFQWIPCENPYFFLCQSSGTNSLTMEAGSWQETANRCFQEEKYPLPYQKNITTTARAQLWLANVRSMTITDTFDHSTTLFRRYGYIERDGNKLILKFGRRGGPYKGLCQNGTKDFDQTSPITTEEQSNGTGTTGVYQKLDDESDESKGRVGVYVGIAFAIGLIIAVVVIGLKVIRKRRASLEKIDNTNMPSNQNINSQKTDSADVDHEFQDITESTNEGYDTIPDSYLQKSTQNNNTNVAYFVLEKHNNADYEFAKEVINETEHVYDTKPMNTAMAITDDYDHTGHGNTALKQSLSDQPYDTTCSVKQKYQDPTYDHTGDHTSYNHTGYNADYDHTGDHTTYNHTWQQKSFSHNGDNTTYDRTGYNADYDHTGDRITKWENADYDHTGDNADYDYTRSHNPYDHIGDRSSCDRIGEHAN